MRSFAFLQHNEKRVFPSVPFQERLDHSRAVAVENVEAAARLLRDVDWLGGCGSGCHAGAVAATSIGHCNATRIQRRTIAVQTGLLTATKANGERSNEQACCGRSDEPHGVREFSR